MQEKYPTATITKDVCGYDQMITVAMKKMETLKYARTLLPHSNANSNTNYASNRFYKNFKPLMCQVFGFTRPIVNCTMYEALS